MLTTYQKAALGILAIGVFAVALVIAAKGPALAATPIVGSGGQITLVTQGNQGGPPPGIVVVGEAKLSYRPDVAYLTLGAVEQAAPAAAAQTQLATAMANAAGVRLGAAISISEIQSSSPMKYGAFDGRTAAGAPTQVPTGDVELTVQMQVQFGILGS